MTTTPLRQVFNPLTEDGFNFVPQDPAQVVTVAKSGAMFTTIQAAINSITDATTTKRYEVRVSPGIYTEDVTLKDYVFIENGLSGLITVVGKVSFTGTGASGIKGITVNYTPTADSTPAVSAVGGTFIMDGVNVIISGVADYIITPVYLSGVGTTIRDCNINDTRTGSITKDFIGWDFAGTGAFGVFSANVSIRAPYTAGTHTALRVSGTGSFVMQGGTLNYTNTSATYAGTLQAVSITAASTSPRTISGLQVRGVNSITGGTATGFFMDSSGGNATFDVVNSALYFTGFTTTNKRNVALGDTLKVNQLATNQNMADAGSGLAIITPFDHNESGFEAWGTGATKWSYVSGTRTFTVVPRGTGIVKSSPVVWAANQSVVLTDLATNYIYMDSTGVIGATTTANKALYRDNIVLFEAWVQGTNIVVTNEAHPYEFTTAVSHAWHNLFGPLLQSSTQTLAINSGANRTVNIVGTNTLTDHGLDADIAAQTPATWLRCVTGTSGKTYLIATSTGLGSKKSDPANTTGTNVANGRRLVLRLGVIKDNVNSSSAQFVSLADTQDYANLSAANSAITAGTVATFSPELKALEICQLGYAIINADGAGAGTLEQVTTALQVFGAQFVSGGTSTSGSLITLNTTNFNGQLSGTETNDQSAWDRIDDFGYIGTYTTGVEYRVGNPVVQNGCVYRCNTLTTAGANTAWTAVKANFDQVSIARYADVTAAEAANANDGNLCYVASTDTFYRYVAAGGAYTRDGTYVLNTGDAGNTRRIGVAGRYVVGNTRNLSTDANVIPAGTTAERSTAVAGAIRYNSTTGLFEGYGTGWTGFSGDVVGPASAVDNELVRFNGTGGKLVQNTPTTPPTLDDAGILNINNATDATTTTDGSLQTDGGLSVVKNAVVGIAVNVPEVDTDVVYEKTTGKGVRVKGTSDGTTKASGYMGQLIEDKQSTYTNYPATGTWVTAGASATPKVSLTKGIWNITAFLMVSGGSADSAYYLGISTTDGDSSTGLAEGDNEIITTAVTSSKNGISVPPIYVNISSDTVYYLKTRASYTGSTPQYRCRITAIRVG